MEDGAARQRKAGGGRPEAGGRGAGGVRQWGWWGSYFTGDIFLRISVNQITGRITEVRVGRGGGAQIIPDYSLIPVE